MLTDSNSKSRKYQYYVGSRNLHGGKHEPRSRAASKENFELPDPSCHVYTMPQSKRLPTEGKRHEQELQSKDHLIRQQQDKIQQLEERYESMLEKTRSEFASFEESTRKVEQLLEDKEETIVSLRQQIDQDRVSGDARLKHQLECQQLQHAINLQERLAEKDERIEHLQSKLEDTTNRYDKLLRDTNNELELGRQANDSMLSRLRNEHERELRQLQDTVSELEDKNSRLMKELYSDQNELRLLRQELQAVKMLKDIEIAQLKSIYSRSETSVPAETKFVTPRTTYQEPTKLLQLERALIKNISARKAEQREIGEEYIRKELSPTP